MSASPSANAWVAAHEALAQRAKKLGLPVWMCNERGMIVREPSEAQSLNAWLASPRLKNLIESAIAALPDQSNGADDADSKIVPIFPDCAAIVATHRNAPAVSCFTVVLALTKPACDRAEFREIAVDAGLPVEAARAAARAIAMEDEQAVERMHEVISWTIADLTRMQRDQCTLNQFGEKLVQAYEETNMLFRFARSLNCLEDPLQLMSSVCYQLQQTLPLRWVGVRFTHNKQSRTVPELNGQLVIAGDLPCDQATFDAEITELLNKWGDSDWTRVLEPGRSALANLVNAEVIAEQITHDGVVIGMLLAGNRLGEEEELSSAEMQFIDATADLLGMFHENLSRFAEQRTLFMGTVHSLTAAIDAKDRYTRGHSERVAVLARHIAIAMGLDKQTVERFHIAGLVHDVGKIGIPEAVLCKPGRLTNAEFQIIQQHPRIGYEILKDIPMLEPMLPGVLHHHERWDGGGYPMGLSGTAIPLIGRVLAMADAFDAMSSNRSYRPAMTRPEVFQEIRRCTGTQFDPDIAQIFLTLDFSEFDDLLLRHYSQSKKAA